MASETKLKSKTCRCEHLLKLAQQLIAKLAWGAMNIRSELLVRPSRPTCRVNNLLFDGVFDSP